MSTVFLEHPKVRLGFIPVKDYEFLCRENPLQYENTELFEGVIVEKMTKSHEHDFYSQELSEVIQAVLPPGFFIRRESGIQINDSDFEPDILVLPGKNQDYRHKKPDSARLIIEIAVSSLSYDREKSKAYAKGNVEEYWIVDVLNRKVEIYQSPKDGIYTNIRIFAFEDEIPVFSEKISLT